MIRVSKASILPPYCLSSSIGDSVSKETARSHQVAKPPLLLISSGSGDPGYRGEYCGKGCCFFSEVSKALSLRVFPRVGGLVGLTLQHRMPWSLSWNFWPGHHKGQTPKLTLMGSGPACKARDPVVVHPFICCHQPVGWGFTMKLSFFFFFFGSHPAIHRGYSWLSTQELPLAVLRGPYGMLGIEPGSAACKANALPTVLLLQPREMVFL